MKKNFEDIEKQNVQPKPSFQRALIYFFFALLLIAADQVTKYFVLEDSVLMTGGRHDIIKGFFHLKYAFNTGAAWSFLADVHWGISLLTIISAIASVIFFVLIIRLSQWPKFLPFSLALAFAGTVGNLIDRIRFGGVVDFLDFQFGNWHFPTFNIADAAIVVGMLFLMVYIFFFEERHRKQFQEDQRFTVRKL